MDVSYSLCYEFIKADQNLQSWLGPAGIVALHFVSFLSEVTESGSSKAGNGTPEFRLPNPGLRAGDVFAFLPWNSCLLQPAQVFLKFKINI